MKDVSKVSRQRRRRKDNLWEDHAFHEDEMRWGRCCSCLSRAFETGLDGILYNNARDVAAIVTIHIVVLLKIKRCNRNVMLNFVVLSIFSPLWEMWRRFRKSAKTAREQLAVTMEMKHCRFQNWYCYGGRGRDREQFEIQGLWEKNKLNLELNMKSRSNPAAAVFKQDQFDRQSPASDFMEISSFLLLDWFEKEMKTFSNEHCCGVSRYPYNILLE